MSDFNKTGVYIPASALFPDINSDSETLRGLLHQLSLSDVLFWCARLNLIVTNPNRDHIQKQQAVIDLFLNDLREQEKQLLHNFTRFHGGADKVTICFRGQLLELMRWSLLYCQNLPNDGRTFEDPVLRTKFIQALLIASDMWAKWVYGDRFSYDGGIDLARNRALGAIRKGMEGTEPCPDLTRSFGRGWTIFIDYFKQEFVSFEGDFKSAVGLSVEDYFKCLLIITTHFANNNSGNTGIFNPRTFADSTPLKNEFQTYMRHDSQSTDELKAALWPGIESKVPVSGEVNNYDYLPIREKPILCSEDDRAIILDPIFYSEKASIGPLFILTKHLPNKSNEIFGAFGKAFEKYACDILKRMYPTANSRTRLNCNLEKWINKKEKFEIDSLLHKDRSSIVMEAKTVWIREDKILPEDHQDYLDHLRIKYGVSSSGNNARQKVKGVGQLARIIDNLSSKQFRDQNEEFAQVDIVYPVLLVYDTFLDAPVHGHFLATEFEILLNADKKISQNVYIKRDLIVHALILLTIEDLENLELSVKHFDLYDLLADYSKDCPDRVASVKNYIAGSHYKEKVFQNKNLANKCLELFEQTKMAIS